MSLLVIDASATGSQKLNNGAVTSGALTTNNPTDVLYALVISDGSSTTADVTVTGAGQTWTKQKTFLPTPTLSQGKLSVWTAIPNAILVAQTVTATDAGTGTADMSIVVLAMLNADPVTPVGASTTFTTASGVSTGTILTQRANSLVWGLYYDTSANTAVTLPTGQTNFFDFADNNDAGRQTYIKRTFANGPAGGSVTINNTAPTAQAVALLVFEMLPSMPSFKSQTIRPHPFSPGLAR